MNYSKIFRDYVSPIMIAFVFLLSFIAISETGNPVAWIWGSIVIFIIPPIFSRYKYFIKIYSLIMMGLIIFSGLILGYTYLFKPIYVWTYPFYAAIGYFLIYMITFAYYHPRKWKGFLPNV